jgi:hypothetical protein
MARLPPPRDPRRAASIPLRPDPTAIRDNAVTSLTRSALASALSASGDLNASYPNEYVKAVWPHDRNAYALLMRSAVSPMSTSDAVELQVIGLSFVAALVPLSAGADLLGRSLQVEFGRNASIYVPGFGPPDADFVGEGMPFPVQQALSLPGTLLQRCKLMVSFSATHELLTSPGAEEFLKRLLIESTAPTVDRVLFSAAPAGPDRPPGLRFGVAPLTPTGGDLIDDLVAIVAAVSPVAGNGQVAIVAAPEIAAEINLRLPKPLAYAVLASANLAAGTIIAIALPALASAVDGAPSIESSREAVLHEHTDPSEIITGVTRPLRSMFQTDSVNMRLRWQISWGLRDARAVAWLQR